METLYHMARSDRIVRLIERAYRAAAVEQLPRTSANASQPSSLFSPEPVAAFPSTSASSLYNLQAYFQIKMRGYQLKEYVKSPEGLQLSTLPDPSPKPHEYLIAIHAAATNFFDLLQIRGKYQTQPPFPWVAGAEFSGVVLRAPTSLPDGRRPKFKEGDKVFGATQGAYATKITAVEDVLRPVPDGWSFFDAAGMITAMEHVQAGHTLTENHRSLRNGSYFVCCTCEQGKDKGWRLGSGTCGSRWCRVGRGADCKSIRRNSNSDCRHAEEVGGCEELRRGLWRGLLEQELGRRSQEADAEGQGRRYSV